MSDKEAKVNFIDEEEVITLYDEQNNPVDFYEIAVIDYEDELYALLQPVEDVEGIDEDEAIICKIDEQDEDTDLFLPVENEELLQKVFDVYLKAVADEECDCGCDCDGECDCDDVCSCDEECNCEKCKSEK